MSKKIITLCVNCKAETNQIVLFSKKELPPKENDDEPGYSFDSDYMVVQCGGCNSISFLNRLTITAEGEEPAIVDTNYPEHGYNHNIYLSDDDQECLPKTLNKLYDEVKSAFENDSEILSGLGLRTLIEATCIEQKVPGNNLQQKIVGLKDQGLISANELPILDKLRLIGNYAAHEIKGLPLEILGYALEIINHILKSIYVLPKINRRINLRK